MEKWGISEKEREQAWEALQLTVKDLAQIAEDKLLLESGKPARQAKIIEDVSKMEDDPYKPAINYAKEDRKMARSHKVLEPNERAWTEVDFMRAFEGYALKNGTTCCVFEGKATPSVSLPFDRLEPHQRSFLLRAATGKAYYHPSDLANSRGYKQKLPCDAFLMVGCKAFVVVMFRVKEKGNSTFYMIPIQKWCEEEERSERRSLTEERAKAIGVTCHL